MWRTKKYKRDVAECRDILFFTRYGVICDLLQYRSTKEWNLFVLHYNKVGKNHAKIRKIDQLNLITPSDDVIITHSSRPMKMQNKYVLLYKHQCNNVRTTHYILMITMTIIIIIIIIIVMIIIIIIIIIIIFIIVIIVILILILIMIVIINSVA